MRKYVLLSLGLLWVALSSAIVLLVLGDFNFQISRLEQALPYTAIIVAAAALIFLAAGLHTCIWRYTSLGDILRVMAAVTVAMGVALLAAFAWNRLGDVARSLLIVPHSLPIMPHSLPIIQWLIMVAGLAGMCVSVRLIRGRSTRSRSALPARSSMLLVIGLNPVTELYLRSVRTFAQSRLLLGRLSLVGILAGGSQLKGRIIQFHKILGTPLRTVLRNLEVHGLAIGRT